MKRILFLIGLLYGCHSPNGNRSRTDSVSKMKDTMVTAIRSVHPDSEVVEDPEEDPATVLHRTIAEYTQPYLLDTTFDIEGNVFQLHLKHYCLMDSAIRVPKYYTDIYKLDSFVTHNYVTRVKLERNDKTILERVIYKKDFAKLLFPQLDTFGVLLHPSVMRLNDTILVHYSISIPLTDVGAGLSMTIDDHGAVGFNDRSY